MESFFKTLNKTSVSTKVSIVRGCNGPRVRFSYRTYKKRRDKNIS